MDDPIEVYQGDTSQSYLVKPDFKDPNALITGDWVCKSALIDKFDRVIIPPRLETTLSTDSKTWVVVLSPDDTAAVPVPNIPVVCYWVLQVSNANLIPPYKREHRMKILVKAQGLFD